MSTDNVKISFDGFVPKFEEKIRISEVMRKIEYDSPSDSTIQLDIRKTWAGYYGSCRVVSGVGIFRAETELKTLEQLIAAIEEKIFENLNIWKSSRFPSEKTSGHGIASAS